MTLLVIGIEVPDLSEKDSVDELADALADNSASFISFVISFLVIGRYWIAHHRFFSLLRGMDQGLVGLNLIYLMFIAFLPFPTALLGNLFENPLSIAVYALTAAVVSGMEVVLFRRAQRQRLFIKPVPPAVYRWATMLSLSPVVAFLLSIPVAFADTGVAVFVWFLGIPFQLVADRYKPEDAGEYI